MRFLYLGGYWGIGMFFLAFFFFLLTATIFFMAEGFISSCHDNKSHHLFSLERLFPSHLLSHRAVM